MPKITIDKERCKGCLLCIGVCPRGKISAGARLNKRGAKYVSFREEGACSGCAQCAVMCPECCIRVYT